MDFHEILPWLYITVILYITDYTKYQFYPDQVENGHYA